MSFRPLFFLAVLLLLPATRAAAQAVDATLVGTVTDAETGAPLAGAHVFIATSMNGTVTEDDGTYRLTGVPLGTLRLYVSILGYEPAFEDLFIRSAETLTFDFQLTPAVLELDEVTITAEDNRKWRRQLEKFTRLFIGETPNAQNTRIVNAEVLEFVARGGEFRAFAAEPLIIENDALGYRIQYFLDDFVAIPNRTKYDGEPLFEEMTPESPEQQAHWKEKRDEAFYGSFRHFMLALLNDKVESEGFKTYSRPAARSGMAGAGRGAMLQGNQRYPLEAREILKPGESPDERMLDFEGFVEIVYTHEVEDEAYLAWQQGPRGARPKFRTAMIQVEDGPTVVDLKGDVLDPYGVTFYYYWAFERVADEVPKEYRPWQ